MIQVTSYVNLGDFKAWSGGKDTLDELIKHHKEDELEAIIVELHPDGMTDTELNDFLWNQRDFIYELVGIQD